jgi:GT2 family glycosyltransferase
MTAPVAIAVVSWNTRVLLRDCLRSMHADVDAGRAQVIVVDNGSTDGSIDLVRSDFPWAQLIESTTNLGFGAAVNLAARHTAKTQWIAAANADIALEPNTLQQLLTAGAARKSRHHRPPPDRARRLDPALGPPLPDARADDRLQRRRRRPPRRPPRPERPLEPGEPALRRLGARCLHPDSPRRLG